MNLWVSGHNSAKHLGRTMACCATGGRACRRP